MNSKYFIVHMIMLHSKDNPTPTVIIVIEVSQKTSLLQ